MTSLLSAGLHIQPTTIAALEAASNIWSLLLEYAQESAAPDMVPPAIRALANASMKFSHKFWTSIETN